MCYKISKLLNIYVQKFKEILTKLFHINLRYPQYTNELVCPMVPDIEWIETLVTLVRQDTGFGFRIVGGTEEGSQVGVDDLY